MKGILPAQRHCSLRQHCFVPTDVWHESCHMYATKSIISNMVKSEHPVPNTEWRRCIGCLKLQIAIRKTATNYRVLFREMTYENKATFASLPPCMKRTYMYEHVICVSYMWINMIKSKHPILNINKSQHPIPKMKTTYVCRFHTRMSCSYRPCGICEYVFVHTHKNE